MYSLHNSVVATYIPWVYRALFVFFEYLQESFAVNFFILNNYEMHAPKMLTIPNRRSLIYSRFNILRTTYWAFIKVVFTLFSFITPCFTTELGAF